MTMNRRDLLARTGGGALAAMLAGCTNGIGADGRKPNILFIMSDDHTATGIGAYGGRLAPLNPTPNIDALAAEGTLFTNVFAHYSICTPSRATILTGQYSQTNGVMQLNDGLPASRQSLAIQMGAAGYETAMVGKWHLKQEPGAFDFYQVLPLQGDFFDPTFRVQGDKPWPDNTIQREGHSSDIITDLSLEWLRSREEDKPFFLMHHYKAPHDFFEYAPRYEDYLADVDIPEPVDLYERPDSWGSVGTRGPDDSLVDEIGTSVGKRHPIRNMGHHMGVDQSLPDREYASEAYQRYVKTFLRCVKGIDDNLARLFDYLKESGQWDNTIIIYTADQGFMLGEHDFIDKRWMYDESMRMPFIVRNPLMDDQVPTSDILVNNTDFAPFILELADANTPGDMQGRSFASALSGETPDDWREATYYRYWSHRAHHAVPAHFGVRSKTHKLIFFYGMDYREDPPKEFGNYSTTPAHPFNGDLNLGGIRFEVDDVPAFYATPPAWELYDLEKDPQELNNVYGDPAYAEVTAELKAEMLRQRETYGETDANYPKLQALIEKHWDD